ncbi:hypothetical protein UFOVP1670_59 [uncultured Caudovirales phage]|uniref:Uncharacterized protein n=1 Tax=uncultured Caudovirales phage TaxID=2100421 RepID=A0A6J5T6N6_9CAUD|nr:hypothetical protein UFOVP1670_59 [uncultured Caudovirales phage]
MRLIGSIGMPTDHSFYGGVLETSRVDLFISDDVEWTPEMLAIAKRDQEMRLRSLAKRMPHRYWQRIEP